MARSRRSGKKKSRKMKSKAKKSQRKSSKKRGSRCRSANGRYKKCRKQRRKSGSRAKSRRTRLVNRPLVRNPFSSLSRSPLNRPVFGPSNYDPDLSCFNYKDMDSCNRSNDCSWNNNMCSDKRTMAARVMKPRAPLLAKFGPAPYNPTLDCFNYKNEDSCNMSNECMWYNNGCADKATYNARKKLKPMMGSKLDRLF